ncbi:conserved hypothetical protein [Desulfonatronospira thiodismutans ASO3-1]|uniref:Uncharacterized protein n=2 Tax=Desulfonatronovibrionaceae TaxID=3031459 RepID=D6SL74_9BACT|nr:conserved hypothetical protein [Desulfonatronospira thiodismutans ASO3-1]RQD78031.1 MAG: hypothetical protein D5S03_03295 [Desulfonatronospira sp. MSAO_Bac3]
MYEMLALKINYKRRQAMTLKSSISSLDKQTQRVLQQKIDYLNSKNPVNFDEYLRCVSIIRKSFLKKKCAESDKY